MPEALLGGGIPPSGWALALLVWGLGASSSFALLHLLAVRWAALPRPPCPDFDPATRPGLTLIRPLKGLDDGAEACHRSLITGRLVPEAVLFVVEAADDPAVGPVERVVAEQPDRCRLVVAPPRPDVLSGKVRNMLGGWAEATTELIGFSDSDVALDPEHLERCVAELLADPDLAAVSLPTLYDGSGWGRLTMLVMTVDNATLGRAAARAGVGGMAVGGLVIARREALESIGGVERLGDALADDLRLARLLAGVGRSARLANHILVHQSGQGESARDHLLRHHRWLMSLRTETPALFWAQLLLLNPVAVWLVVATLLATWGSPWATPALVAFGLVALARVAHAAVVDRVLLRPHGVRLGAWSLALPAADLLYAAGLALTLLVPVVHWRGRWFRVRWASGRILRELGPGFR